MGVFKTLIHLVACLSPIATNFFAELYNILRWDNVLPGRHDTASGPTGRA
jgi:hypothetical protein